MRIARRIGIVLFVAALVQGPRATRRALGDEGGSSVRPGHVACWRGEGDGADSVGGHHGTLLGSPAFGSGVVGQAFAFDGIDDALRVPDAPALNPTTGITLAAWLNTPEEFRLQRAIFVKPWVQVSQPPYYQYALAYTNLASHPDFPGGLPQALTLYLSVDGSSQYEHLTLLDSGIQGRWAHVAATYDGASMRIYVDGVLRASRALTGAINVFATPLAIGDYGPTGNFPGQNFKGGMDELELFGRALSDAEVEELHEAGLAGVPCGGTAADTTPPEITLLGSATVLVECGQSYADAGATAFDDVDGDLSAQISVTNGVDTMVPGDYEVLYRVSDAAGNSAEARRQVRVVDTTAPTLDVTGLPTSLWPPDHRLVRIVPTVVAHDPCAGGPVVTLEVSSNEAENGLGDGDTSPDFVVRSPADFDLRAERAGGGEGRVYTLVWTATDASGNTAQVSAHVTVPRSRGPR
jgi:hypothetical protein